MNYNDSKPLVINGDTKVTGEIRLISAISDDKDEFVFRIEGWMRLDDLISMLARIQTVR